MVRLAVLDPGGAEGGGRPNWTDRTPKKEFGDAQPDGLQAVARLGWGLSLPEIRCLLWHLVLRVPRGIRCILVWVPLVVVHPRVALGCHRCRLEWHRLVRILACWSAIVPNSYPAQPGLHVDTGVEWSPNSCRQA